ncbi:MAG: cupin domain-containing protein [Bacteroidota bacterium]|nr:cupin domain-containing protein [Bacteroidota bacterium]
MKNISEYIQSGIIEAYVLGLATSEEIIEVESLAASHVKVQDAIDKFSEKLEQEALANAVAPNPIIKPLLMATIDFMDRMEKGEAPSFPPDLNEYSNITDYAEWLNKPGMVLPSYTTDLYAKIISYTPQVTTAIVWIKEMAHQEVHHAEHEKFLIVEGTCTVTIEDDGEHYLKAGDFLAIPLYKNHIVKVTSDIPCKVILQRVAA